MEQQQHHKYQRSHTDFPHKNLYRFISAVGIQDMQTFWNPSSLAYSRQMDSNLAPNKIRIYICSSGQMYEALNQFKILDILKCLLTQLTPSWALCNALQIIWGVPLCCTNLLKSLNCCRVRAQRQGKFQQILLQRWQTLAGYFQHFMVRRIIATYKVKVQAVEK